MSHGVFSLVIASGKYVRVLAIGFRIFLTIASVQIGRQEWSGKDNPTSNSLR